MVGNCSNSKIILLVPPINESNMNLKGEDWIGCYPNSNALYHLSTHSLP